MKNSKRRTHEKHGFTKSITYTSWAQMKARTVYKNSDKEFPNYKNIRICKRWKDSFVAFLEDMGERPSLQHSLDRINNEKGYYPKNCRWASDSEQMRNRGDFNISIMYSGKLNGFQEKIYLLCELAELSGVNQKLLRTRLHQKMPLEKALIPFNYRSPKKGLT